MRSVSTSATEVGGVGCARIAAAAAAADSPGPPDVSRRFMNAAAAALVALGLAGAALTGCVDPSVLADGGLMRRLGSWVDDDDR